MYLLALIWSVCLGLVGWGTLYSMWRLRWGRIIPPAGLLPPVSILKPLKGLEPGLDHNLESFAALDYPDYEIILTVADPDDPVIPVVRRFLDRHPGRRFSCIVGAAHLGANPKVNNLHRAWPQAHEVVLVSDSNIRAQPGYLREIVPVLDGRYGIVSSVVGGFGGRGFWGEVEELHLNSFYARWMMLAECSGLGFCMGKSMLYRQTEARRFGGLDAFAHHIAEDYQIGQAFRRIGLRIGLQHRPVLQFIGPRTFKEFWSRHLRWSILQRRNTPAVFWAEPFQFSLVCATLGALAMPWPGWVTWGATLALWYGADFLLITAMGSMPSLSRWWARELTAPLIWCHALLTDRIDWRGHKIRVGPGGLGEDVKYVQSICI